MRKLIFVSSVLVSLCGASMARATETVTYTYDARGRILQITHSGTVNNGIITSYSHDIADNRTQVTTTGASH